jgi:Icc-related predicted phosphoesterase
VGYISGAMSIDRDRRTPGCDWWPEEELSIVELSLAVDEIVARAPRIIISHQAPQTFEYFLEKGPKACRTNEALENLLSLHAPELWVCGHHHVNEVKRIGNTIFVCVDQNRAMSLFMPPEKAISLSDIIFE